jgi:hypothetical protein
MSVTRFLQLTIFVYAFNFSEADMARKEDSSFLFSLCGYGRIAPPMCMVMNATVIALCSSWLESPEPLRTAMSV